MARSGGLETWVTARLNVVVLALSAWSSSSNSMADSVMVPGLKLQLRSDMVGREMESKVPSRGLMRWSGSPLVSAW